MPNLGSDQRGKVDLTLRNESVYFTTVRELWGEKIGLSQYLQNIFENIQYVFVICKDS